MLNFYQKPPLPTGKSERRGKKKRQRSGREEPGSEAFWARAPGHPEAEEQDAHALEKAGATGHWGPGFPSSLTAAPPCPPGSEGGGPAWSWPGLLSSSRLSQPFPPQGLGLYPEGDL